MRIIDLGLMPYAQAVERQQAACRALEQGGEGCLFLLEHPPVITFGRNGGAEHLPHPAAFFTARGIELAQSTRGGSITCHFPGQLVAYPILRLDHRPGGLRRFFADLEESVIQTLAHFGLTGARLAHRPGVWIEGRKICSIGIAVKRWISSHGLALNVARDLALFELINPCGLPGVSATSMQRELQAETPTVAEVKPVFTAAFCRIMGLQPQAPAPRNAL